MAEGSRTPGLRVWLVVAVLALGTGGIVLFRTAPEPERVGAAGEAAAAVEVAALRVERRPVTPRIRRAGVLEARRSVEIRSETRGRVTETGAEELDRVEDAQLLVRIDPLQASIAVERAEASVARRESELALARTTLERRRTLAGRDVASAAALDDAENAARVAEAALREARAALEDVRDELGKKTIRAPFAGVLRLFPIEVGEYVEEGQRVAELLDLTAVRILVGLTDIEVVRVAPGVRVGVELEAHPGERFEGAVLRVGAAADQTTKKFPVEVEIPNPDDRLLPGMVARVALSLGAPLPLTLVPRDATLQEYGLRFVYVLERDGQGDAWVARKRRVEVRELPFLPAELEVVSGLRPGEEIALTSLRQLRDGMRIRRKGNGST